MSDLKNITYCGLYCKLCATKSRIPQTAIALRDALAAEGWEDYGEYVVPDFKTFWSTLNKLSRFEEEFPDCRGGVLDHCINRMRAA